MAKTIPQLDPITSLTDGDMLLVRDTSGNRDKHILKEDLYGDIKSQEGLASSLDELSDVDITTTPPTEGSTLVYDNGGYRPQLPIRQSLLDNPLTHLFKKNKLVDTLSGFLSISNASTIRTYKDLYGFVRYAGVDEPREESKGWLIEGASTNLCLYSEDFNNASWIKSANVTVTPDNDEAPDGNMTADTLNFTATGTTIRQDIGIVANNSTYSLSVYLKGTAGETIKLQGRSDDNSIITEETVILTSIFSRYSIQWTNDGTKNNLRFFLRRDGANTAETLQAWGAQLEELPFETSYIPTTNSPATRLADDITFTYDKNISKQSGDKSVAFLSSLFGIDVNQYIFDTDTATDFRYNFASSDNRGIFRHGGDSPRIDAATNELRHFVGVYQSNGTLKNYLNGELMGQNMDGTAILSGVSSKVRIGADSQTLSNNMFGHIRDFRIYDFALNSDEVRYLG